MYILRILSHGHPQYIHGNQPAGLADQIMREIFNTDNGEVNESYFSDMINQGKGIHIILDTCDTGAYYINPKDKGKLVMPYTYNLGKILKEALLKMGLNLDVTVEAPNAETTYFAINPLSRPEYNRELNGNVGKIIKYKF